MTPDHPKGSQRNVPVQKQNDLLLIEKKLFGKKKKKKKKKKPRKKERKANRSISVSKTRAILLFKIKIKIEMFELHQRMPGMSSDLFAREAVIQLVTSA